MNDDNSSDITFHWLLELIDAHLFFYEIVKYLLEGRNKEPRVLTWKRIVSEADIGIIYYPYEDFDKGTVMQSFMNQQRNRSEKEWFNLSCIQEFLHEEFMDEKTFMKSMDITPTALKNMRVKGLLPVAFFSGKAGKAPQYSNVIHGRACGALQELRLVEKVMEKDVLFVLEHVHQIGKFCFPWPRKGEEWKGRIGVMHDALERSLDLSFTFVMPYLIQGVLPLPEALEYSWLFKSKDEWDGYLKYITDNWLTFIVNKTLIRNASFQRAHDVSLKKRSNP